MVGRLRLDRGHGPPFRPSAAAGAGLPSAVSRRLLPPTTPATVDTPAARRPGPGGRQELRISPWARIAIAFPAVLLLIDLTGLRWPSRRNGGTTAISSDLALNAAQNHQTRPVPTAPEPFGGLTALLFLFAVAAVVVECIWQFRAASAARATAAPGEALPRLGGRLLVHPHSQPLDALSGHPGLPGARRPQPGRWSCATGCSTSA